MIAAPLMLALLLGSSPAAVGERVIADARDASAWKAFGSEQVEAAIRRDADGSLCLEYDFRGVSGYAVMRRSMPVEWPRAFALRVRIKGRGGVNDLQLKLVDASGDNVWWVNRPGYALPRELTDVTFKQRHFGFAWGPAADKALARTETLELAVAAGRDRGKGALCIAQVGLEEREADPAVWPAPLVRTRGRTLELDLRRLRELNGLVVQWPEAVRQVSYDVLASPDARRWTVLRRVRRSSGGFDALYLPESEARHLKIRALDAAAPLRVDLRDSKEWPDFNAVLSELAHHAPRGHVPRAFLGQQNYWALVGVAGGGEHSALLSEDGALELGRGGFSVEPAVLTEGQLVAWADVQIAHSLREGHLPLPEVHWRHGLFALDIAVAAEGQPAAPKLLARYALKNTSGSARAFKLLLAVRPWQVNPPQQFLNTPGGARRIDRLRWKAPRLIVDEVRALTFAEPPDRVTAMPLAGGIDLRPLRDAPALQDLTDEQGYASALLEWDLTLQPGETRVLGWSAPLGDHPGPASAQPIDERMEQVAAGWRARLGKMELTLPASSHQISDTLRTAHATILISADRAALEPGTRSYARSWIRDGAMMVAGLVRLGELDAARDFVDWFKGFVFASGKVPCCVDARGADPVVENDSHGEYLYAVAEVWRHSRDKAFLARHWEVVQRVVAWLEGLRQSTRTAQFAAANPANLRGLMPPSISHEGYSDKPAFSYWDDFWALRGYKDAVVIAQALGETARAAEWAQSRDEFQAELAQSLEATAARFGTDLIVGAADRGDFDATSTSVALNPAQARVSAKLLKTTFERYWQESRERAARMRPWKDYTPYELRNVGVLVRLGQSERAHELLKFFMHDRRPEGWNQWAEVVLPNPREPHFLGDMPHAWVASDYLRSVLDMFAYEREEDDALVLGAGLSEEWLASGVAVKNMSTAQGPLSYALTPSTSGLLLQLAGGISPPRGGVRFAWPLAGPLPRARHGGIELPWTGRELVLPTGPTTVQLIHEHVQHG
jgi:hypothetical protein